MPSAVPLLPTLLVLMPACAARRWFCASVRNPAEAPLPKDGGDTPAETHPQSQQRQAQSEPAQ